MSDLLPLFTTGYILVGIIAGLWAKPDTNVGDEWFVALLVGTIWPAIPILILLD